MPIGEAKAGWPTFDVAKLSSLITNLVARYQPIQPALIHINQLKTSAEQVQSFAKAVVSGDINAIGKQAQTAFKAGAFLVGDTMHYMDVAKGSNGVKDAMKNLKNDFFALDQKEVTSEDKTEIAGARVAAVKAANKEAMVTTSSHLRYDRQGENVSGERENAQKPRRGGSRPYRVDSLIQQSWGKSGNASPRLMPGFNFNPKGTSSSG